MILTSEIRLVSIVKNYKYWLKIANCKQLTSDFLIFAGMEKEIQQTKDFLQQVSDFIHYFVRDNVSDNWLVMVLVKLIFLGGLIYLLDFIFKTVINLIFKAFSDEEKYPAIKAIYTSKITNTIAHFLVLIFASLAIKPLFEYRHPKTFPFFETLIQLGFVLVLGGLALRFLKAIKNYFFYKKDFYRIVALNAVSQTLKTIGIFIFTVIAFSVVFRISGTTILGSLGAITAVLVLVFRDTILGFMTGIHVATSKSLKVGDWIGIPKYNLEGTILEINLITTKIQNFDKTVSTIPTYDLLSTEIKNHQVMAEGNRRRIKKSIVFNINSFKFIDEELFERLKKVNLISEYLEEKASEISVERTDLKNPDFIINGRQLTNIGVFRRYALNYLKQDKDIDQNEVVLVRQLEITSQGMPLEIYCFSNRSAMEDYEEIQADIFDHLLASAKIFDLEIMQVNKI